MRLTITEFSNKYGIDKQYILENLDTVFAPYVVKEKGISLLDDSAYDTLSEAEGLLKEQPRDTKEPEAEGQEEPRDNSTIIEPPADQAQEAEAKAGEPGELEKARQEIEQLKKELEAERSGRIETEKRLLDMMDKVIELTENAQKLTAMSQNRLLLEAKSADHKQGGVKAFFCRLFGKKEKPLSN